MLVGVPISALFLWLALDRTHPRVVWETLSSANVGEALLASALLMVVYAFQARRWRGLAEGGRPVRSYARMVVAGVAVSNVVPGRAGDWLRASWLARLESMSSGRALATVVFDRCADVVALAALVAVALPFTSRPTWLVRVVLGGAGLVILVLLFLAAAQVFATLHRRVERQRSWIRRVGRDVLDGLARPPAATGIAVALMLSLAAWLVWAAGAWLAARSIGVALSVQETLLLAGIVNLGVAIPSSPGFVGTYQWLTVSTLGVAGIDRDPALAFAVLLHAAWYIPTTLAGAAMLILHAARRPHDQKGDPRADLDARAPMRVDPAADERPQHS